MLRGWMKSGRDCKNKTKNFRRYFFSLKAVAAAARHKWEEEKDVEEWNVMKCEEKEDFSRPAC